MPEVNSLMPGAGGLVSGSPKNELANPPAGQAAAPPSSPMMTHFGSKQDEAAAKFRKIKGASEQLALMRKELEGLADFGDTISTDDVVSAAAGMVSGGIDAGQVAGSLADMPEQPAQLQGWVKEQLQKLGPQEQQVQGALQGAGYELGRSALHHIIAASAEQHHQRLALAAAQPQGSA